MKVLFLLDNLGVGGAERSLLAMVRRFREVEPTVCHLFAEDALAADFRAAGARVEWLGLRSKRGAPLAVGRLARTLARERMDLLQLTGFFAGFVGRFAGRRAGVPIVDTFTNESYTPAHFEATPPRSRWKLRLARRLDRRTFPWVERVVAVSEAVREANCRALGVPADRVEVVYRGRDPKDFAAPDPDALASLRRSLDLLVSAAVILNVSRLIPRKGVEDLVRATARVRAILGRPIVCLLAGEGHHREALEGLTRELDLDDAVRFLGRRGDVPSLLHLADVFAFPSRFEGHPGALVEAMLSGRPIVASDIPVHRETLEDRHSGLLFTTGDVNELADKLVELLRDPTRARKVGERARERSRERFAIDRIAARYEALYREILSGLGNRRSPFAGPQ